MPGKKLFAKFKKNVKIAPFTGFNIGGKADYFFEAETKKELVKAVFQAKKEKIPFFILGKGSNLLVSDKGFKGLVIRMKIKRVKVKGKLIEAGAGASLAEVVKISLEESLSGLEWAAGIPGTLGGAVFGNAGAFGKSMKEIVKEVEVLDSSTLKTKKLKKKDCRFSYRESFFKKRKNLIILSVILMLRKKDREKIKNEIKKVLKERKEKQPLNFPSAGSVFKNPKPGLSAAFLIEECGLKGKRFRGAEISKKHANFIINSSKARAKDVFQLIKIAKKKVEKKFGIKLKEEIEII
jgi:UDP-N-acetylmuramate dehydrogenase